MPEVVPVMFPEQVRFPVELLTVQPVAVDPPAIFTSTDPSVCRFKAVLAADSVPPLAKPKEVAVTDMVSMEGTPVKAPPVVTFSPPFEVKANVPVPLPMLVLAVPVVLMLVVPTRVAPAVAVNRPFNVSLSPSAAGINVAVVAFLDQ